MSKLAPTKKVLLGGKERTLKLDLNGMIKFEETTGKNMLDGKTWENLTTKDLRALLWACLIHEDEGLTLEQAGALIHVENLDEITNLLFEAWGNALPEKKGDSRPLAKKNRPHG